MTTTATANLLLTGAAPTPEAGKRPGLVDCDAILTPGGHPDTFAALLWCLLPHHQTPSTPGAAGSGGGARPGSASQIGAISTLSSTLPASNVPAPALEPAGTHPAERAADFARQTSTALVARAASESPEAIIEESGHVLSPAALSSQPQTDIAVHSPQPLFSTDAPPTHAATAAPAVAALLPSPVGAEVSVASAPMLSRIAGTSLSTVRPPDPARVTPVPAESVRGMWATFPLPPALQPSGAGPSVHTISAMVTDADTLPIASGTAVPAPSVLLAHTDVQTFADNGTLAVAPRGAPVEFLTAIATEPRRVAPHPARAIGRVAETPLTSPTSLNSPGGAPEPLQSRVGPAALTPPVAEDKPPLAAVARPQLVRQPALEAAADELAAPREGGVSTTGARPVSSPPAAQAPTTSGMTALPSEAMSTEPLWQLVNGDDYNQATNAREQSAPATGAPIPQTSELTTPPATFLRRVEKPADNGDGALPGADEATRMPSQPGWHHPHPAVTAAPTARTAPATAPTLRGVVVPHLDHVRLVEHGVQHLKLQLDPPGLGECEIELVLRPQGLHATVITDRPDTALAVREAEPLVREALAQRGLELSGFQVASSLGEHTRQSFTPPGGPWGQISEGAAQQPATSEQAQQLGRRPQGRVSLLA